MHTHPFHVNVMQIEQLANTVMPSLNFCFSNRVEVPDRFVQWSIIQVLKINLKNYTEQVLSEKLTEAELLNLRLSYKYRAGVAQSIK